MEEIREVIDKGLEVALCGGMLEGSELYTEEGYYFLTEAYRKELVGRIKQWLSANGVVRKVEGELPSCKRCGGTGWVKGFTWRGLDKKRDLAEHKQPCPNCDSQQDMLKAGYCLTKEIG